ncbi:MAG: FAD-binding protein, partial [Desulfobacterales bacterium]|nr:FAD-binding protein [Desulfobacterales bacterium]
MDLKRFFNSGTDLPRFQKDLIAILGADQCCFDVEDRAVYAFDAGEADSKTPSLPSAVVFPENTSQVSAVMAYAHEHQIPVIARGAGSGLTGGAVPHWGGIVLSLVRMDRILDLDTKNLCAVVESGVVTADLQAAAAKAGLFYPPDPASQDVSTMGGNIAENSGGMRAAKYGVTKQYVLGLEVVLADGRIVNLGSKCIKDVAGYSMTELFIGSEGTFGIITQAIVKLVTRPERVKTLAICFDSIHGAGAVVPAVMKSGIVPCTLEFIDSTCLDAVREVGLMGESESFVHGDTRAMLLLEVDGRTDDVERDAAQVREICGELGMLSFKQAESEAERENLWHIRRSI